MFGVPVLVNLKGKTHIKSISGSVATFFVIIIIIASAT